MARYLALILVALTSCAAYLVGARGLGLPRAGLRAPVWRVLECVGLSLIFLVANLVAGVLAVLALRVLTKGSVSLYLVADETLPALSFVQGLMFAYWRDHSTQISNALSRPDQPR